MCSSNLPTPAEAMAKLVLTYARKVRSDARWSLATLPTFSSLSENPFFPAPGSTLRRWDELIETLLGLLTNSVASSSAGGLRLREGRVKLVRETGMLNPGPLRELCPLYDALRAGSLRLTRGVVSSDEGVGEMVEGLEGMGSVEGIGIGSMGRHNNSSAPCQERRFLECLTLFAFFGPRLGWCQYTSIRRHFT